MDDAWKDREKAKENEFFERENKKAMERLQSRAKEGHRVSPATGKPMVQHTIQGVLVDRCPDTGGVWIDGSELQHLLNTSSKSEHHDGVGDWLVDFFEQLFTLKK